MPDKCCCCRYPNRTIYHYLHNRHRSVIWTSSFLGFALCYNEFLFEYDPLGLSIQRIRSNILVERGNKNETKIYIGIYITNKQHKFQCLQVKEFLCGRSRLQREHGTSILKAHKEPTGRRAVSGNICMLSHRKGHTY